MSGVVPARIAASLTMGELAVLTVVARQCQRGGTCSLCVDAIAALAGCSRTTAQNAMREGRRDPSTCRAAAVPQIGRPKRQTMARLVAALEAPGVEVLPQDGVRRRRR